MVVMEWYIHFAAYPSWCEIQFAVTFKMNNLLILDTVTFCVWLWGTMTELFHSSNFCLLWVKSWWFWLHVFPTGVTGHVCHQTCRSWHLRHFFGTLEICTAFLFNHSSTHSLPVKLSSLQSVIWIGYYHEQNAAWVHLKSLYYNFLYESDYHIYRTSMKVTTDRTFFFHIVSLIRSYY